MKFELDLVDRVPEELWTEVHNIVQGVVIKTIPKKKKCKKANWLSRLYSVPLSTLQYLRRCRRSTAPAPQGSISAEADDKCLVQFLANVLGKCQFVVDKSNL